jgi:hypothetical protein
VATNGWDYLDRLLERTGWHIGSATVAAFFAQAAGRGESMEDALYRALPWELPPANPEEQQSLHEAAKALWADTQRRLDPPLDSRVAAVRDSVLPAMAAYAAFSRRLAGTGIAIEDLPAGEIRELLATVALVDKLLEFVQHEPAVALFDGQRAAELQSELSGLGLSIQQWISALSRRLDQGYTS